MSADGVEASTNNDENDGDDDEDSEDDNNDNNNDNDNNEWWRQSVHGRSNTGGNGNDNTKITYVAGEVGRHRLPRDNKDDMKCCWQQH